MAALDHSIPLQPSTDPFQTADSTTDIMSILNNTSTANNPLAGIFDAPTTSSTRPPIIRISRGMFDIRRVLNSQDELKLFFDIPPAMAGDASMKELQVHIEHDKQAAPNVYTLRVSGTSTPTAKTFPLNAEKVDISEVKAVLHLDTSELEVIAPKNATQKQREAEAVAQKKKGHHRRQSSNNPFVMAVEAIQNLAMTVTNASWNSDFVVRKVPITKLSSS